MASDTGDDRQEFALLVSRAGLEVPEQMLDDLLPTYQDLQLQLAMMRRPRPASTEPAHLFRLEDGEDAR